VVLIGTSPLYWLLPTPTTVCSAVGVGAQRRAAVGDRFADDVAGVIGHHHRFGTVHAQTLEGVLCAGDFLADDARVLAADAEAVIGRQAVLGVQRRQLGDQSLALLWRGQADRGGHQLCSRLGCAGYHHRQSGDDGCSK
jgi:hypothetical protein